MLEFLKVCEEAARAAGKVLLDLQGRISVREKGPRDLVTEADLASQETIQQIVLGAFPDHDFLGEEDSSFDTRRERTSGNYCWIVDPLDGTTNYVHRLQTFSVSVALERQGQILVGVVFDPIMDECYSATANGGALLNGSRLSTSKCSRLTEALVAASLPAAVPRGSLMVSQFVELLYECRAVRRLGSAALNMCYLAAGRLDAYWAPSIKIWDIAAGLLIVREAGGVVTDSTGGELDLAQPKMIAAANDGVHRELIKVVNRVPTPDQG